MNDINLEELNVSIGDLAPGERLVLEGIPEELYHQSVGIGSTLMKAAMKSMAHYKVEKEREWQTSADLMIGSAVHKLVLEPEQFDNCVVKIPDDYKTNNSQKFDKWAADHEGKILLRKAEIDLVSNIANAILDQVGHYFIKGEPEKSYWYRDEETGLTLKARIDYQIGDAAVDLKTTRKGSAREFNNAVKYEYGPQDSLYRLVSGVADMLFVGVAKENPHPCFLSIHGKECRTINDDKLRQTLRMIKHAEELGVYTNAPVELMETHRANWEL